MARNKKPHDQVWQIQKPLGHDRILERFQLCLARGRMGSGYLFVGPPGIGKRLTALWIAQSLLCQKSPADQLEACGSCPACQQVAAGTHADFDFVGKPADRSTIPVELLIGDTEHRMREGLCARIAMSPAAGGRRIAIIDDADHLSQVAANCLLKTLEEPPSSAVLILIGTSAQRQLPTIRSRCQVIPFDALSPEHTRQLLVAHGTVSDDAEADRLATACGGSLTRAIAMCDREISEFHIDLCHRLSRDWQPLAMATRIVEFVEAAGKDAPARRQRQCLVMEWTARFYRDALCAFLGVVSPADQANGAGERGMPNDESEASARLAQRWMHSAEALAACIERSLDAEQHVMANANQTTNIEAWMDDLWELTTRGMDARRPEYIL